MSCCDKSEHDEVRHVLTNLITQLCKNGVKYSDKLHIEGLVGVTIDHCDVFFVRISETIDKNPKPPGSIQASRNKSVPPQRQSPMGHGNHGPHGPHGNFQGGRRHTHHVPIAPKPHLHNPALGASQIAQAQRAAAMRSNSPGYRATPSPKSRKMPAHDVKVKPEIVNLVDDMMNNSGPPKPIHLISHAPPKRPFENMNIPPSQTSSDSDDMDNVTVIAPKNDSEIDDTEAMRQGYQMNDESDESQPASKRHCAEDPNAGGMFVSQWPLLAGDAGGGGDPSSVPTTVAGVSSPPFASPEAYGNVRGFKNPRNNTMAQPVRDVLEHNLAKPILADAHEVTAFRLFWRGQDTITGWNNIIYNRMELDAVVAEFPGVSFFISAITATARDPKTIYTNTFDARQRAYPALGYWVATRENNFDRHALMKKVAEVAEGAELKAMLQCDGEKANEVGALNLIVKDYGKGFVQQRIKESAGEDHPTIRFILKEDFFESKLLEAVDLLSGVGCPVSLEKVETGDEEDEDGEDGETGETAQENGDEYTGHGQEKEEVPGGDGGQEKEDTPGGDGQEKDEAHGDEEEESYGGDGQEKKESYGDGQETGQVTEKDGQEEEKAHGNDGQKEEEVPNIEEAKEKTAQNTSIDEGGLLMETDYVGGEKDPPQMITDEGDG